MENTKSSADWGSREKYFQLVIVRHGETEYNRKQVVQGQLDVPLSSDGLVQADRVATRIARMEGNSRAGFDLIFSSDLSRAKQTADAIVSQLERKRDIVMDNLLRERALGDFEERTIADFVLEAKKNGFRPNEYTPKGGESLSQLVARARDFFSKLLIQCSTFVQDASSSDIASLHPLCDDKFEELKDPPEVMLRVLVVSHGGWIRSLLEHLLKTCPRVVFPKGRLGFSPNTGITSLLVGVETNEEAKVDSKPNCTSVMSLCMNDGSHL